MWSMEEDEPTTARAPSRPDCPGCGAPDLAGDDFCHECGHGFSHFGAEADPLEDERGAPCPMCASGELASLEHGRTQCDSCGYMVRDEG